jgi:hypothetical protein
VNDQSLIAWENAESRGPMSASVMTEAEPKRLEAIRASLGVAGRSDQHDHAGLRLAARLLT